MRMALHMPHIQIHLPQLHLQAPATGQAARRRQAPSCCLPSARREVLFNTTKLQLDRPLAAQQSVVFGPLRQIFEYGGGSLAMERPHRRRPRHDPGPGHPPDHRPDARHR